MKPIPRETHKRNSADRRKVIALIDDRFYLPASSERQRKLSKAIVAIGEAGTRIANAVEEEWGKEDE